MPTHSVVAKPLTPADLEEARQAPLFANIALDSLVSLLEGASVFSYGMDSLLFSQGDLADRFFVVLEGQVRLVALTEDGSQTVVEVFEPICTFAEAAIFASARFPLSADVSEGSRLIHIPAAIFLRKLAEDKSLAFKMLAILSQWQKSLIKEIYELKVRSPGQRLGLFLLSQTTAEKGAVSIRLPLKKTLIASRIGITPESLSRAMARLKALGVESHGNIITISDVAALKAFCNENEDL